MRFSVFTHVEHEKKGTGYYAYAPYVREMNLWFAKVEEVEVVAPLGDLNLGGGEYEHVNLTFTQISPLNFSRTKSSLFSLFKLPCIIYTIFKAMHRSDHIHLRCPGNIGLVACFVQIFFPQKNKTAKYAGNWDPEAKQPWSYKLQRRILSNTFLTRNMTVLIYGNWPNQSENILPFFTASFSETEIEKTDININSTLKFLFIGNLVNGKQPWIAFNLVEALHKKNIDSTLSFYGDGPLLEDIKRAALNKSYIRLHGNQPLDVLKDAYKDSHFVVLVSKSEGWPKAIAEAMFFGCIPVASSVSCLPWMLDNGKRGILAPPAPEGDAEVEEWLKIIISKIVMLRNNQEEMRRMSVAAKEWSQQYTLEGFEEEIKKLLFPQAKGIN